MTEIVSLYQLCGFGFTAPCCPGARAHAEERTYHELVPEERQEGKESWEGGGDIPLLVVMTISSNLFQKEDEQRRRRKSKAQFFEMIQEIRRFVNMSFDFLLSVNKLRFLPCRRVQQEEKEQPMVPTLAVVEEIEPSHSPNPEIQSIASSVPSVKPKASPKLRIFSLKRDGHSRSNSNSSSLNVRRFSTEGILGERLDTIGRRLSRDIASDLANSPPDLGHRFETFGKAAGEKFDTFSGKTGFTKSADDLDRNATAREKSKFDTFSGSIDEAKPSLPAKRNAKSKQKRKPLSMDVYENKSPSQVTFENQSTLPMRDPLRATVSLTETMREPIRESYRESYQTQAGSRDKLQEEKNGRKLVKTKPPKVPSTANRPSMRSQTSESFLKVQSNDSLHTQTVPSTRPKSRNLSEDDDGDDDDDMCLDPTYATIQPRNKSPRLSNSNIQLGRLSKEDLLSLSSRTETEIHEFLNGSKPGANPNNKIDPP